MGKMERRSFLKRSAGGVITVGLGAALVKDAGASAPGPPPPGMARDAADYHVKFYPFVDHPESDACWSLSTGPDGRVYAAACAESVPGGIVKVYRYNEETDALDFILDAATAADDPGDSGRATQCKIHYSFAPSMHDNILYMATHLSGPPIDLPAYSPWYFWHDPERCFKGSALIAYDTKNDKVLWSDTLIPKEGCRCLLHDEERGLLYALGYPRDHFIIYDIKKRERRDLGRISSVNPQALFLDKRHRVWTTSDDGKLVRYDPDRDRLEHAPGVLPHNPNYQTGWHSVFYDVVAQPDGECVYATTWSPNPYLIRIWPNEGDWPVVEDLGPMTQDRDQTIPENMFRDHAGGLVFGGDGMLYVVASRWRDPVYNPLPPEHKDLEGVVWRIDPKTLRREEVAVLLEPYPAQYVSRGAVDHNGDLFFAHIGPRPMGIYKITVPKNRRKRDAHLPIRMWG